MKLESALRARRDSGGRAFVPYVTGGFPGVDAGLLRSLAATGADAIEVGVPFSDPVIDGGIIQEASTRALETGTKPSDVFATIRQAEVDVPIAVMTYANPVFARGWDAFAADVASAGVSGLIVPDLPADESDDLRTACEAAGIDLVQLAAPGTDEARYSLVAKTASGFVYCVATYGVTGAKDRAAEVAQQVVSSMRPLTDLPLLVGVGIGTPEQAAEACGFADGVIVGSALMSPIVEGDREGAIALAERFRAAVPS